MINTQYGNVNIPVTTGQNVNKAIEVKTESENTAEIKTAPTPNRDTFEHSTIETAATYSPETIGEGVSVNSITPTTTRATTDYQIERIPKYLVAKMVGLSTHSDGSPIINSTSDYNVYVNAYRTMRGDHAKLYYKSEYCYSQNGESYGNPNPKQSCGTFAFATALSIKYNKKITPDQIVISETKGYVIDHWKGDDDRVVEWKWKDGNSIKTAYRIYESRGADTFEGIDAQLQLGNPVLIHTSGKNAAGVASEHWATVIGKQNGKYTIIDPWDGSERSLEDMEIYKNGGSVLDYTILTNEY